MRWKPAVALRMLLSHGQLARKDFDCMNHQSQHKINWLANLAALGHGLRHDGALQYCVCFCTVLPAVSDS